jgi:hemoglobin
MNRTKEIFVPPEGPGNIPPLSSEIYESMGSDGVFGMLEAFYTEIGESEIRDLFPEDLVAGSRRSAAFYVQVFGGPPIYNNQFGNPMMRRRHFPFEIDEHKRLVWLACFNRVVDRAELEFRFPSDHIESFRLWLGGFSKWMVNVE